MTREEFLGKYLYMAKELRDDRVAIEASLASLPQGMNKLKTDIALTILLGRLNIVLQVIEDIKELE